MEVANTGWPAGRLPQGGVPCDATNSLLPNGNALLRSCHTPPTTTAEAGLGKTISALFMASSGFSILVPLGAICLNAMALGKPFMADSIAGEKMVPGIESSVVCCIGLIGKAESSTIYGVSIPRSFALPERPVVLADADGLAWAETPRRNCESQKIMRWVSPEAASARRFIWSWTRAATSWASGSALDKDTIHEASSRRCNAFICRGDAGEIGGPLRWRAIEATAIRRSAVGYEGVESKR